jgi:hypothetical protein
MTQHVAGETVAGYRLVRKLGSGSRSEVFLGVPSVHREAADGRPTANAAAIKLFREAATPESIGRELDALSRSTIPHCIRLLDIGSLTPEVPVAVVTRVQRLSLGRVVTSRGEIELGEAVTLLAPIVRTVSELHRVGVCHGSISPTTVHFGSQGEPMLISFGRATIIEPGLSVGELDSIAEVAFDRWCCAALSRVVLDRVVNTHESPRLAGLREWIVNVENAGQALPFEFLLELEERIFDLADPLPIDLADIGRTIAEPVTVVPSRIGLRAPVDTEVPREVEFGPRANAASARASLVEWRGAVIASVMPAAMHAALGAAPLGRAKDAILARLREVRKPVWIAFGAIAVALTIALAVVPNGGTGPAQNGKLETDPQMPTEAATASVEQSLPDDPTLALPLLSLARERCIRELSVLCLDDVDQQDSSALRADAELIRRIQAGEVLSSAIPSPNPSEAGGSQAILVERLGDSALVRLGGPTSTASVLMIRTEAGWRIRGYLPESKTSS